MRHSGHDPHACLPLLLLSIFLLAPPGTDTLDVDQGTPTAVRVPETDGPPVMIDGIFAEGEWDDAFTIEASDAIRLYLKQEKGYVYIGVRCAGLRTPIVDLFLQPGGGAIHQLHASAQIGEIVLSGPGEEDPRFAWGYSPEWTANEVRWDQGRRDSLVAGGMDRGEAQIATMFAYDGFEFQIRKSRFDGARWLVRFDVHAQQVSRQFPPGTAPKDVAGWLRLDLGA